MPNVRGRNRVKRNGYHTRAEINKTTRPALARDDLSEAFAGDENLGKKKDNSLHSTNVKSRRTKYSKYRTPKR